MRGDPLVSPFVWQADDYLGRVISITVDFDNSTKALLDSVVHRDTGCLFTEVVIGLPSSSTAKTLAAPADGQPDNTYTAKQMSRQGLNTIDDVLALQMTAR